MAEALEVTVARIEERLNSLQVQVARVEGKMDAEINLVPTLIATALATMNDRFASKQEFKLVEAILLTLLLVLLGGAAKMILWPP